MLNTIQAEVSFGCTTIHIYRPPELESGQIGYSISPTGQSLVGDSQGDWRRNWLIIGYSDAGGDPLFIDTSEKGYPVYTAMVGQGRWAPKCVAVSLEAFAQAISVVAAIAHDREYPVALERNPLKQSEKETALAAIQQYNPKLDTSFWETLLISS